MNYSASTNQSRHFYFVINSIPFMLKLPKKLLYNNLSSYLKPMQKSTPLVFLFKLKLISNHSIGLEKCVLRKCSFGFSMELVFLGGHL